MISSFSCCCEKEQTFERRMTIFQEGAVNINTKGEKRRALKIRVQVRIKVNSFLLNSSIFVLTVTFFMITNRCIYCMVVQMQSAYSMTLLPSLSLNTGHPLKKVLLVVVEIILIVLRVQA